MNAKTVQCPNCGNSAAGKFCSFCGTSLTDKEVPSQWNAQMIAPWAAIGLASIALIVALVSLFDRGGGAAVSAPFSQSMTSTVTAPGQPVDLTKMTSREAADQLFNRVMTASESGDTMEALRFAPMALQAYDNLGALDYDARYHVALIHLTSDDFKSARVQIDKIRETVPNHLLAFMLEHQIAVRNKKKDSAARASKAFLSAYDKEIAAGRIEYQEHRGSIDRFHKAAKASMAGKK
ncbi:MAG TPA: hypothetical protein VIR61_03410 [Sulfuricaulis sp.]